MRDRTKTMPIANAALLLLCALLLCRGAAATAQDSLASVDGVKAGFLFNFAKFTEWPVASAGETAPLRICAVGRNPLDGQLALLQGRRINNRTVEIRLKVPPGDWPACHLLYLASEDGERVDGVLKATAHTPVLTVGDLPGFAQKGGMIELREMDNRMRFEINLAAARQTGLNLSSQMLKLATRVWQ